MTAAKPDSVNEGLNLQLIEQVQELERRLEVERRSNADLQSALGSRSADSNTLKKILEYMPQLTYLNNSTSALASAQQLTAGHLLNIEKTLGRIADALEAKQTEAPEPAT